jgi:ankyrin repeat protein
MDSALTVSIDLLAAASHGNRSEIDRLLALGGDPNFRDVVNGGTCLHRAVANGNLEVARLLLEHGADPSILTQNTWTSPLGVAALAGNVKITELLLASGARLSEHEIETELLSECRESGFHKIASMIESSATE